MGCAGSAPRDDDAGDGRDENADMASKQLEKELEDQQAQENAIIKLLVLGTGESGKSTVFKQMKILYSKPDPPAKFVMICRANLFGNAHAVMDGMEKLNIEFKSDEGKAAGAMLRTMPADGNPPGDKTLADFLQSLKDMYKDAGCVEAIERAAEYQLNDSTIYFWERADVLCAPDYEPNEQDVLRARVRTTGIVQQNFDIEGRQYTMFDVGGQRNERRKWIHCFDNVTAVIFVTAISEYDQVLYEDENTNRMDEALVLFDQICNHQSFMKTSMILFLNKRDLFEMKLKKKDLTCWESNPDTIACGQDYEKCIAYIKARFIEKNKDKDTRQVYVHATCATDTNNIRFVMDSVFDIILKDNLRKLQRADIAAMTAIAAGTGKSDVVVTNAWDTPKKSKIMLVAVYFTDGLKDRDVMVDANNELPAVRLCNDLSISDTDWQWIMGLGKDLPALQPIDKEKGSFKGNFKEGVVALRKVLDVPEGETLGSPYDMPITMTKGDKTTILIPIVKFSKTKIAPPAGFSMVVHEDFEKAHYAKWDDKYNPDKVKAPSKGEEFNPFAANPVGFRWFKGVTLFTKEALKVPDKGVYLGIFKVVSLPTGFKVMVNEHNRILIPMIFLTETQISGDEKFWMHGVRVREEMLNVDLLEGKQPNRGWLGPEMSGEEGATFAEKLWWAIDEAKARLDANNIGKQYDYELLKIDENDNIQLLLFGMLAENESEILAGHIWVDYDAFESMTMKFLYPNVLSSMIKEKEAKIAEYQILASQDTGDVDQIRKTREQKESLGKEITKLHEGGLPLKWVFRVIFWCSNKMKSFADGIECKQGLTELKDKQDEAKRIVEAALERDVDTKGDDEKRTALIAKYMKK